MQPDSEHEQDDADPGELGGQPGVGDESGRERAHGDSGEEIADGGGARSRAAAKP